KVAPTAMMAMKALRVATLARLVMPMKFGLTSAPTISRSRSAAKGATARRSTSRQLRRGRSTALLSSLMLIATPASRPCPEGIRIFVATPTRRSRRFLFLQTSRIAHDLLFGDVVALEHADDPSFPHHRDAGAESDDLGQFGGHDDDR